MTEVTKIEKEIIPIDEDIETIIKEYMDAGFFLIPLYANLKKPIHKEWEKKYYDYESLLKYAEKNYNFGVQLQQNQLVIDVDPRNYKNGEDSFEALKAATGFNPTKYPCCNTGSGGQHIYTAKPLDLEITENLSAYPGIEFKTKGRQVVAAGSVHPNGSFYEWNIFTPTFAELKAKGQGILAPKNLLTLISKQPYDGIANNFVAVFKDDEEAVAKTLEMLERLDPKDFSKGSSLHDIDWFHLMASVHQATNGQALNEFIEWCIQDEDYNNQTNVDSIIARWNSLKIDKTGNLTIKTLFYLMRKEGHDDLIPQQQRFDLVFPGDLARLKEMNKKFCAVMNGKKTWVYRLADSKIANWTQTVWVPTEVKHFKSFLVNEDPVQIKIPDKKGNETIVEQLIAEVWYQWPERRQAAEVIFNPEQDIDGFLNTWTGWAVKPKEGSWSLLKELIETVLCDNDADSIEFVYNWIAYMVQFPWRPAEVAICFHGDKGTGKSTLGRFLCDLAGHYGQHATGPEQFLGRDLMGI